MVALFTEATTGESMPNQSAGPLVALLLFLLGLVFSGFREPCNAAPPNCGPY